VEIMGDDGKALMQAKVRLNRGKGDGSFVVPVTVNSGYYLLRSYTSWMKNFDTNLFFRKSVSIVNPFKVPDWTRLDRPGAYMVRFYPEGGDLVSGLNSKIGFEAMDQDGRGVPCNGAILDQSNDTVARFQTLKFGLGSFRFTPVFGN